MTKKIICAFSLLLLALSVGFSQDTIVYKRLDTTKLYLEVYRPKDFDQAKSYPAMVFFFGGGWIGGTRKQFEPHAKYFAQREIICFLADYRIEKKHKATPFESLEDAKSAIRFIRKNAYELAVDTNKIIAAGGSAGGQLAAACAMIEKHNDPSDDLSISCIPNALVLFNPVIDNGPGGYGYRRIGEKYKDFSPLHNIKKGNPPTILFQGTKDHLIPVETVEYFKTVMLRVGNSCSLLLYEGQGHGFFNYRHTEFYKKTVMATDRFL
ncbi:MAG: alpha/beta hydrolase [Saonia sp.]